MTTPGEAAQNKFDELWGGGASDRLNQITQLANADKIDPKFVHLAVTSLNEQRKQDRIDLDKAILKDEEEKFRKRHTDDSKKVQELLSTKAARRFDLASEIVDPARFNLTIGIQKSAYESLKQILDKRLEEEVVESVNRLKDKIAAGIESGTDLQALIIEEVRDNHPDDETFRRKFKPKAEDEIKDTFKTKRLEGVVERTKNELRLMYMTKQEHRFKMAYDEIKKRSIPTPATPSGKPPIPPEITLAQVDSLKTDVTKELREVATTISADLTLRKFKTAPEVETAIKEEVAKETGSKSDEYLLSEVKSQLADLLKKLKEGDTQKEGSKRKDQNFDNAVQGLAQGRSFEFTFPNKDDGTTDRINVSNLSALQQEIRTRQLDLKEELAAIEAAVKSRIEESIAVGMEDGRNPQFATRTESIRRIKQIMAADRISRKTTGELLNVIENKHNALVTEYSNELARADTRSEWEDQHPNTEARKTAEAKAKGQIAGKEEQLYASARNLLASRDATIWDANSNQLRYDSELADGIAEKLGLNLLEREELLTGDDPKLLNYLKDIADVLGEVKTVTEQEIGEQYRSLEGMMGNLQLSEARRSELLQGLKDSRENIDNNRRQIRDAKRKMTMVKWGKRALLVGGLVGTGVAIAGVVGSVSPFLQTAGAGISGLLNPAAAAGAGAVSPKLPFALPKSLLPLFGAADGAASVLGTGPDIVAKGGKLLTSLSYLSLPSFILAQGISHNNAASRSAEKQQFAAMKQLEIDNRNRRSTERTRVYDILKQYAKSRLQEKRVNLQDNDFNRIFGEILSPAIDGLQKSIAQSENETAKLTDLANI